jgi:hypothetical protein
MPKPVKRKVLFQSVKSLIAQAQQAVVRNVNTTMLLTYFEIGRMVVEDELQGKKRADYADETLKNLSANLIKEFGRGYSKTNLEYMCTFYQLYQIRLVQVKPLLVSHRNNKEGKRIAQTVSGQFRKNENQITRTLFGQLKFPFELTWSHYIQLLRIKNEDERNFYEIAILPSKAALAKQLL